MGVEVDYQQSLLTSHLARYPSMQVQDLYKLLHQAALGSEHAVRDERAARGWLERELAEMGAGPDDPLLDPISPDGQIVRIHLRPYVQAGKDPEALLKAFIRTANEWKGTPGLLKEYASAAAGMMQSIASQFLVEEIESFFATMEAQGFPAVHHSGVFASLYRPAYRVIARQFLEEK
jgi:hypothetical protein